MAVLARSAKAVDVRTDFIGLSWSSSFERKYFTSRLIAGNLDSFATDT